MQDPTDVQIPTPGEIVVADRGGVLVLALADGSYGALEGAQILRAAEGDAETLEDEQRDGWPNCELVAEFRSSSQ